MRLLVCCSCAFTFLLRESRGRVTGVELASGDIIQADVVLVGVGAIPSTGFLKKESNNSFAFTTDGGVITDPLLR